MSLLGIGASLLGGLLGSGGSKNEQKSKVIDPRLGRFVYGEDGKSGMVGDIASLYRQQMAQGGLNDMQRSGMEMQRQTLMSPQYTQGYDAMRSMGMNLMGGGIAQNPFTNAAANRPMPSAGQAVARPNTNMHYQPFSYAQNGAMAGGAAPIQSVAEYQQAGQSQAPSQQSIDQMIEDYMRRMGLGKYGESARDGAGSGGMADYGGYDGGMLGLLGLGGYDGGLSSIGGADVSMGSAAGNGGDNGAETGGGMSGSDGNGGGFGGDSGDGYAKGGKVTKKRLSGPNPKGPDDGYAALDEGEFVINAKSAKRIGHDKLAKMNRK